MRHQVRLIDRTVVTAVVPRHWSDLRSPPSALRRIHSGAPATSGPRVHERPRWSWVRPHGGAAGSGCRPPCFCHAFFGAPRNASNLGVAALLVVALGVRLSREVFRLAAVAARVDETASRTLRRAPTVASKQASKSHEHHLRSEPYNYLARRRQRLASGALHGVHEAGVLPIARVAGPAAPAALIWGTDQCVGHPTSH